MDARKLAAQFAAYAWYEECQAGRQSPSEAARFAMENWTSFLSVANEGWGRLLIQVASQRENQHRKHTPSLAVVE